MPSGRLQARQIIHSVWMTAQPGHNPPLVPHWFPARHGGPNVTYMFASVHERSSPVPSRMTFGVNNGEPIVSLEYVQACLCATCVPP